MFSEVIFAENTFLLQLFFRDLTDHIHLNQILWQAVFFRQLKVTCRRRLNIWFGATMARFCWVGSHGAGWRSDPGIYPLGSTAFFSSLWGVPCSPRFLPILSPLKWNLLWIAFPFPDVPIIHSHLQRYCALKQTNKHKAKGSGPGGICIWMDSDPF